MKINSNVVMLENWRGQPWVIGDDNTIAKAARQSLKGTDIDSLPNSDLMPDVQLNAKSIERILRLLAERIGEQRNDPRHTVPFEHTSIQFKVILDVATHVQLLKHRIGWSTSSESARWQERSVDRFYIPDDIDEEEQKLLAQHNLDCFQKYHTAMTVLVSKSYSEQRAREIARYYLGYATQIESTVTCNFLSFIRLQQLRNTPHAQPEIQFMASEMRRLIENTKQFDISLRVWNCGID